jgi:TolB-like protein
MRRLLPLIVLLSIATLAHGAEPTTRPRVLILRFAQLNDAPGFDWIGRVVQESLLTEISRDRSVRAISSQQTPTTDLATAVQIGREARANLVVVGGYQMIGDDLKITGQTIDTQSGEIVGALKSTATVRDVLDMEETLGRQLGSSLHRTPTVSATADPRPDYPTLGPVRVAAYTQTFAAPKSDPHQQFRDRYTYGVPAYSPYLYGCYGWCGYGGYWGGCNGSWITPVSIFYGD